MDEQAGSGSASRAITQTRDMTLAEALVLTKAVNKAVMAGFKRDRWYLPIMLSFGVALGALAAIAISLSAAFRCCDPRPFWVTVVALPAFVIGSFLYQHRLLASLAKANKLHWPAGTRHAIDETGYSAGHDGQQTLLPWRCIVGLERKAGLLLLRTSTVHFWAIAPEACEGQDAEGFCAEFERRWNAARGAAHAG